MQTSQNSLFALGMLALLILMAACKGSDRPLEQESQTVIDNHIALSEFMAVRNLVDMEAQAQPDLYGKTLDIQSAFCTWANTTVTPITANRFTMEVDFGGGTNCSDGRLRTGKIIVEFSGKWDDIGTSANVTFENYTTSGNALEADMEIIYRGLNTDSQEQWDMSVSNGHVYTAQGTIDWAGEYDVTQVEGSGTPELWDNQYLLEGSASGRARTTLQFSSQVLTPLRNRLDCRHMTAGVQEVTPLNFSARQIDYGQETCDNVTLYSQGDFAQELLLP